MDNMILSAASEESAPLAQSEIRAILEAILFAAGHPVTYDKLAEVLRLTPGQVRRIVEEYAAEYDQSDGDTPRGILLLAYPDSCQLCTKETYGPFIREALGIRRGGNLSVSSLEVLAIVAYNEPVTRAYIDTVRGVDSSYSVTSLSDKHLIEPCGRLDAPGRPLLYRTTPDFLRVFGISSLKELPQIPLPAHSSEIDTAAEAADVPSAEGESEISENE